MGRQVAFQAAKNGSSPFRATNFVQTARGLLRLRTMSATKIEEALQVYGMQRATVLNALLKRDTLKDVTGFDSPAFLHF